MYVLICSIMNIMRFVQTETLESPFAPKKKEMSWLDALNPISSGVSALGNLLSPIFGASSQSSANRTNLEIAKENQKIVRETNDLNAQLVREANAANRANLEYQNAFNLDMWNKQNEYNSPANQLKMYKQAGINPLAVLGNLGSVSAASSLQSGSQSPSERAQMVAPQLDYRAVPVNYGDYSGIGQIGDAVIQARLANAQIRNTESQTGYNMIRNEYETMTMMNKLARDAADAKRGSIEASQAEENLRLFRDVYDYQKRITAATATQGEKQVEELETRIAVNKIQRDLLASDLKIRDKMNQASYNALLVGISETYSKIRLNDASTAESVARTAVENMREAGMKLDNKTAERLQNYIVDKAREEVYQLEDIRYSRPFELNYQMQGKAGQYFPMPSGRYGAAQMYNRNKKRDLNKK